MTFEKVAKIIADFKEIDVNEITMKSTLNKDLGLDSLDTVELIMNFEQEFNITLEPDPSLQTIEDVVNMIDKEINK
jgi:acyl carrier protein